MKRLAVGAFAVAAGLASLGSCKTATQATLEITTDLRCSALSQTRLFVTSANDEASTTPTTETSSCETTSSGGRIGTLSVVPQGGDGRAFVRVVAGVDRPASECAAPAYTGCIVARRLVTYVKSADVKVPIPLLSICKNVPCDEATTCNRAGRCVAAAVRLGCEDASGCRLDGDGDEADASADARDLDGSSTGDGGTSADGGVVDAQAVDASFDAAPDASALSVVTCKGAQCLPGFKCCADSLDGDIACASAGATCPVGSGEVRQIFCDSAGDCPAGVCCFAGADARCVASCPPPGVIICPLGAIPNACPVGLTCSGPVLVEVGRRRCL